ncbi:hypothetical protein N7481_000200 [Penicillium waksmanii]|uniref:uncharacterized protein n=1 Tax=Penicillium waksmanii TaxID=69791 RepID=UPI002549BC13|nr:uncharacterized protein N7481_000200 [Penicillium waksmanii]KAJ5999791.1 hypothetical protein N7481_000200 [Penicillium waksmanii]
MPLFKPATDDRSGIPHWRRTLAHLAMYEDLHALPHATSNFLFGNMHHVTYRRWRRKRAMNSDFGRTIVLEVRLDLRPNRLLCAPLQSDIELPTPGCGNPNIPVSSCSTLVLRLESRAERHRKSWKGTAEKFLSSPLLHVIINFFDYSNRPHLDVPNIYKNGLLVPPKLGLFHSSDLPSHIILGKLSNISKLQYLSRY